MAYTQIKIKLEYREKLARLASLENRSMANMIEVLIDQATTPVSDMRLDDPNATTEADTSPEGSRLTSKGETNA